MLEAGIHFPWSPSPLVPAYGLGFPSMQVGESTSKENKLRTQELRGICFVAEVEETQKSPRTAGVEELCPVPAELHGASNVVPTRTG